MARATGYSPPFRGLLALALFALLLICACAPSPPAGGRGLAIDGLSFENRSTSPINHIQLLVPATGNFVSCGFIAPGNTCASGFPGVAYHGEPIEISWNQGGEDWNSGRVTLQADEEIRLRGEASVMVVVLAPGSAGAVLVGSRR